MKKYVIVVAGGKGLRMGGDIPKQFIPLQGKPVLMRTLEAFHTYDSAMTLIVVLPVSQQAYWEQLCLDYGFTLPHRIADGGETRFHSVKNGLQLVLDDRDACGKGPILVGVHDGVRPFVSQEVIAACYETAAKKEAAIPVTDVVETLRHIGGKETSAGHTVPRCDYKLVQTPQVFTLDLLEQAYRQPYSAQFTDDASVVEACGHAVHLVNGNRENIKLTTPFDLKVAEALL